MNDVLRQRADTMVENYALLKQNFRWETVLTNHFGAMVHTTAGKRVSVERINDVKNFIKDKTGRLSQFRGTSMHILANLLCIEDNYHDLFVNVLSVYEKLKQEGFHNSMQLHLSAFTIAKEMDSSKWDMRIRRMNDFYKLMKKNHFWLTSSDDYVFAAVLANTDKDVERTIADTEGCYRLLNAGGMSKGNYLQSLSHVLAICEEDMNSVCQKALKIHRELKERKCSLNYQGLASIGVLALVASDVDKIIEDVTETYEYIYQKDGYGFWSLDKTTRAILAASLVSDYHFENIQKGVLQITLGNSIASIIIAQQTAAVAAACAASAAATSAT